ncbi:MAG: hypothetical protein NTW29_21650 [Bacteroidetes bacterium]|nr:hypothetical protein [Bacteroidota bacterium]
MSKIVYTCCLLAFLLAIQFFFTACGNHHMLKEVKTLDHYPSASGMEYVNGQLFIIGDDANQLLILDSNLAIKDSIRLYDFPEKRIPKDRKADLESITLTADNKLLLMGSGSKDPYRNTAWLIDPQTHQKDSIQLDTFYARLKANNIHVLNLEGSCAIPGYQLLSNRGSKGYPKNQLIFTHPLFWEKQAHAPITALFLGVQQDSTVFNGVSGMAYARQSDRLLLTVSTEDTRNAMDDGAIGKSYLWMIKNISGKKRWSAVNPDIIIDLEEVDHRFKGQKIESVCIMKESTGFLDLLLAADNDNGTSTLFKVSISKE